MRIGKIVRVWEIEPLEEPAAPAPSREEPAAPKEKEPAERT